EIQRNVIFSTHLLISVLWPCLNSSLDENKVISIDIGSKVPFNKCLWITYQRRRTIQNPIYLSEFRMPRKFPKLLFLIRYT
ncbi:unnamed protein product, partial [Nesidiocoris tenuis]